MALLDTHPPFHHRNLAEVEFQNSGDWSGVSRSTDLSEQLTSSSTFWMHVLPLQSPFWSIPALSRPKCAVVNPQDLFVNPVKSVLLGAQLHILQQ